MFKHAQTGSNSTKRILYLGQFSTLLLMLLLVVVSMTLLDGAKERMRAVVLNHNEKTDTVTAMRTAARERTVSLQKMLVYGDAVAINEELFNFTNFASEFIKARDRLFALSLSTQEKALLKNYLALVKVNASEQKEVINYILSGRYDVAREKLLKKVIPLQDEVFETMSKIIDLQKTATKQALADGESDYRRALHILVVTSILTFLIVLFIVVKITKHITRSESVIASEKERAHTTLHSIGDAVIAADSDGRIEQINEAAARLLGVRQETVIGQHFDDLVTIFHERKPGNLLTPIKEALNKNQIIGSDGDIILVTREGNRFIIEFTASPIYNLANARSGAVLVIKDVTEHRQLSSELAYQSRHDFLTGLLNRQEIENILQQLLKEYRRYGSENAYLGYLDLDQFKIINDTCGHAAGDELLKQVAQTLTTAVRETDYVSRMGGDEFIIILKKCDKAFACQAMDRIRESIMQLNFCQDGKCFDITASIGLVPIRNEVGTTNDLLSAADTACFIAKDEGRNRIHIYTEGDDKISKTQGEMAWVQRINQALANEEFELFYQAIKPLNQVEDVLHGEILLRLRGENDNYISPYTFIPAAERYNLMPKIDRYVIEHTFDRLNQFSHLDVVARGVISINLSAQSMCEDNFLEFIQAQLDRLKLNPATICFEITETAVMSDMSRAIRLINELKKRGCQFALDDFGSGLSSFGYLKNLSVDYLKIDGCFIKDINNNRLDYVMVSAMNQIANALGIKTIAEFVEDPAIENTLSTIGITYGQGYGIHKPESFLGALHVVGNGRRRITA